MSWQQFLLLKRYKTLSSISGLLIFGFFLLSAVSATGQSIVLDELRRDFTRFSNQAIQEKIYLHTDRPDYLAGEIMWFKVYVVDGSTHKPLDLSKVVYVEILDKENLPALQAKIPMNRGSGKGSFYLPLGLKSGNYKVRAYTNWMKNFGPELFFEKEISLVNTFTVPELTPQTSAKAFDVQFFPEGGALVTGIRSKVAFKAVDPQGKGLEVKGAVVSSMGDTVATLDPLKFGMGHFYLQPDAQLTYQAVISAGTDSPITFPLPATQEQGYVMHLEDMGEEQLQVTVNTTLPDRTVYLLVHARQQVQIVEAAKTSAGKAVFNINKNQMAEGISHMTLFNGEKQPLTERLYFIYPRTTLTLQAATDKKQYTARQKVDVQLAARGAGEKPAAANLSMAVYMLDSLSGIDESNILSYLWLSSELKGMIESPSYYFGQKNPEVAKAMDNLLLTQGWRRFNWEDVFQKKDAAFTFIPEYEGHIIKAVIMDKTLGAPAAGVTASLSVPGKLLEFQTAKSNEDGALYFITEQFFGSKNIFLQSFPNKSTQYSFKVINPYSDQFSDKPLTPITLSESLEEPLRLRHIHTQAQNTYWADERNKLIAPDLDSVAFYGAPDKTYRLDDFVRFPSMEDVMREYVYEVRVRKQRGKFVFKIIDADQKDFYTNPPLVLLDGVPVTDTDDIMAYNPLKVQKLEVLTKKFVLGEDMVFDGIVNYTTYKGTLEEFPLDPDLLSVNYEAMQFRREFYSPTYEAGQAHSSRRPDFRNLLHWAPEITTDENGQSKLHFYTSDLKGKFIVVVQGISSDGNAGVTTSSFEVKEGAL